MHFYRFSTFFGQRISRIFLYVLNRRQRRRTRKLYMIVTVVISYFCAFLRILWLTLRRPSRSSNLVPRLCRGGRCATAILTDRSSRKQKYLDYDVSSRRWSRTTARPCRARDGVGVIFQPDYNDLLLVNFYA